MATTVLAVVEVYLAIGAILGLMLGGVEIFVVVVEEDAGVGEGLKTAGIAFLSTLFLWPLFVGLLVQCELKERK